MSRIEKLQLEAIKELSNRMKKLEREKQTQMIYTIPKVDLCNWSLFQIEYIKTGINIFNLVVVMTSNIADGFLFLDVCSYYNM